MRTPTLAASILALVALVPGPAAQADVRVGVTAAVNPQAIGQPPTEPERVLLVGTDNFANEKITTGPAGQVQLLFVDGSSISVGPDANLTIDQYVYDPSTRTGKLAVTATQGVFRLVGGAISKSGEMLVTTPTATVGIRGGIGVVESRPNQPMRAQFLFGTSLRVTAANVTQEATRPGFQITVAGPGQPPSPPQVMTTADVRGSLAQFQGRRSGGGTGASPAGQGGQGGQGGQEAPQDAALAQSNVSSSTGSNLAPQTLGPTTSGVTVPFNPNANTVLQNVVNQSANVVNINQASGGGTGFTPNSSPNLLFGHFYSNPIYVPGSFNPSNGAATYDPNHTGNVVFALNGSNLTFALPVGQGNFQSFTLPFKPGQTYPTGTIAVPNGTINGTVAVSSDPSQFFAVLGTFTPNAGGTCGSGKSNCGFGFFGGKPTQTTASSPFPTSGFATYAPVGLSTNSNDAGRLPFSGGLNTPKVGAAGVTVSPMFTVFGGTQPGRSNISAMVQSSLWIQGSGANQNSGMVGMTSTFFQEQNSTVALIGGVVGMTRDCAGCVLNRYASSTFSAPTAPPSSGLTNGNAIYGSNANFIVAIPDQGTPIANAADTRTSAAPQTIPFDSLMSSGLQSGGPDFDATLLAQSPGGISSSTFAPRSDTSNGSAAGNLRGYTGGLMDIRNSAGGITTGTFQTQGGPNVFLGTNPANNRMGATFNFNDTVTRDAYRLSFGDVTGSFGTRDAFINDMIFASRDARDSNLNPLSTFNGTTVAFNRLFMVSSAVVPIDFQTFAGPGVTACVCAFMQWGWWIGEVQNPGGSTRERFNLATWVTGTLPATTEIPATGTATYNGHAIGNVSSGGFNYIAAGNFQGSWNFGSKSGSAMISNFDRNGVLGAAGVNVSGTIRASNGRDFTGTISGANSLSGPIGGSFFKNVGTGDPIAGMGGAFAFSNASYKAGGTFAAQK
jgi:hypothetical protein